MFDIGLQEMLLIGVIALLVFGPNRLPELGRMLGRAMREFKRASDEFRSTVETNLNINDPGPFGSASPSPSPSVASTDAPATTVTPETVAPDPFSPQIESVPATEPSTVGVEEEPGEPFVGQRSSRIFHRRECVWVTRIPHGERTHFKRITDARDQGLMNCPVCEPWEPS